MSERLTREFQSLLDALAIELLKEGLFESADRREDVRDCVESLSSLSEGWVMVPKEPTPEMLAAMNSAGCDYHALNGNRTNGLDAQREVYAAMLRAAPPVGKD